MHEYSIVQALYDRVAGAAADKGATAVHRVRVRIGEMSGVDPGLLATAWETFRVRTLCEHAPLDIDRVAAVWDCSGCGRELPRGAHLQCPSCGRPARLRQGDEIVLEQIEMEVE